MKNLLSLLGCAVALAVTRAPSEVVQAENAPVPLQAVAQSGFVFAGSEPFDLLAHLIRADERGETTVELPDAPNGWLRTEHVALLIELLDSDQPCAGIHSWRDSFLSGPRPRSTVGHEAGYMILGLRHGLYPKGHAYSVEWPVDTAELRSWWQAELEAQRSAGDAAQPPGD